MAAEQIIANIEAASKDENPLALLLRRVFGERLVLERAVRSWASVDPVARAAVLAIDRRRLNYVEGLMAQSGLSADTARARAHQSGVTLPIQLVAAELSRVLGRELVGIIADKEDRTVRRWLAGDSRPSGATAARLRDTYQIVELLRSEEGDHTIRAWFMGMNPQLDDSSPTVRIRGVAIWGGVSVERKR